MRFGGRFSYWCAILVLHLLAKLHILGDQSVLVGVRLFCAWRTLPVENGDVDDGYLPVIRRKYLREGVL